MEYTELYKIYCERFENYPLSYETFCDMLNFGGSAKIFEEYRDGVPAGFCVAQGSAVTLLCVKKEYEKNKIGSKLLSRAEQYLAGRGQKRISLGLGGSYIFQGVPTDCKCGDFFEKHGYRTDYETANMELSKENYRGKLTGEFPAPGGVTFRFSNDGDKEKILKAVDSVDTGWTGIFREADEAVLIAEVNGEIAGFELVSDTGGLFMKEGIKHGCIGCVGVVPKYRRQGIGLAMTAYGSDYLISLGCEFIQLLFLVRINWYGKLGYEVTSTQKMMYKNL